MNSDKAQADVELEIGGRVRKLLFTVNAACVAERELGREILTGKFFSKLGFLELRALLFAMLLHEEKSLTIDQVGSWMTFADFGKYINAIIKAYKLAMPDVDEAAEKKA